MLTHRLLVCSVTLVLLTAPAAVAQRQQSQLIDPVRERAQQPYLAGLDHLRAENFEAALESFQDAVELDPSFDMAYYMLGRTHMMMKSYVAAVAALSRCRDIHLAEATDQSRTRQEIQHQRRQRIGEINDRMSALESAMQVPGAQNVAQMKNELQMLQERKRQIEDAERQLTPELAVPSYVSLALGSAYFRSGKLAEAEQAYIATLAADRKVGEAHSNLAVVYMETGRLDLAEKSLKAAEKAGLKVHPALKDEINRRKAASKSK